MAADMMGKLDPSPIPAYAVTMWSSDTDIFVALPMTIGGVPYIMRFALSEGGLTKALAILRDRRFEAKPATLDRPANYTLPATQPMIRKTKARERLEAETTPEQRERARALLEKLGLKPR